MSAKNRRVFLIQAAAAGSWLAAGSAMAQGAPLVSETDPQAMGLGYKADTTKVDAKKYPKHDKSQKCSNCQLYQGKPTDKQGGCAIFPGKAVAADGWCSAWVKKAG